MKATEIKETEMTYHSKAITRLEKHINDNKANTGTARSIEYLGKDNSYDIFKVELSSGMTRRFSVYCSDVANAVKQIS